MAREGVAPEATAVKAELGGIRSGTKASAGTRRLALSELRLSERLARPSYEAAQSARPRRAGEPDHTMCWLSPASACRKQPLNLASPSSSTCGSLESRAHSSTGCPGPDLLRGIAFRRVPLAQAEIVLEAAALKSRMRRGWNRGVRQRGRLLFRRVACAMEPVLKNEHIPQQILPVSRSGEVLCPFRSNGENSKEAIPAQAGLRKQFFGPFAQRSSEPAVNGNAETHFGALQKFRRNILVENLTENPLAGSIANFEVQGQLPGKLDNAVVQQRNARLETHSHAGTVHFGENVVRQIIEQIGEHHELFEGGNPR